MNKLPFLIIPVLILLIGCAKKNIPQATSSLPTGPMSISNFDIKNTDFLYFSSKSDFHYKDNDDDVNAIANLRMKKDSIIWINISAGLGIEAMRGVITTDSIIIVDKLKKQYVVYDFPTLSKRYNFKIDFTLIQNLILGNAILDKSDSDQIVKEANYFVLSQKVINGIVESFISEKTAKLEKVVFSEYGSSNILNIEYGKIAVYDDSKIIPNRVSMDLDYTYQKKKYNVLIDINHQKAEFSEKELKFPFNIPAKYERVE